MRRQWFVWIFLGVLFLLSRFWVLANPPCCYSDVKHDYERYANIWRYGLTPYRKIVFEYPPAAVPLVALPLELDQQGIGKYYQNYRTQIFVLELIIFGALLYGVAKSASSPWQKYTAILFYILAGVWAKDFWYEGLDLVFFGMFAVMLVWQRWTDQRVWWKRILTWALFWLTVSLKIMTGPLGLPLLLLRPAASWKKELTAVLIGFLIIWAVPLIMYRSSLSVFLVFHAQRPLKYGAFGSYVIETINSWTHSEIRIDAGPDFPMSGPVSKQVTAVEEVVFPLTLVLVFAVAAKKCTTLRKHKFSAQKDLQLLLNITFVYLFALFITGKTFSSPFHIWYVPLLTLYAFPSFLSQVLTYLSAGLMLGLDTTPFLTVDKSWRILRDGLRFLPMVVLGVWFARRVNKDMK